MEHMVRVELHNRPLLLSLFSGQRVAPDRLDAHWVCREGFGPWVLESVWVEGAVVLPLRSAGQLRDGLLYADDAVGAECSLERAPRWVRTMALRTQWVQSPEGVKEFAATA